MADFSSLKQTIQTYIKQNGNEEITGNILQDVLLAMVSTMGDSAINRLASALQDETTERQNQDAILRANIIAEATALGGRIDGLQTAINGINTKLAEGYIYAGIATPSTNPGTPSGKVFYVAVSSGTYTNFSNLTVAQGINILKYNGSAWSKDVVYAIDERPKKASQNLVTSGGVFDNIGALDVSELNATENPHTLAQYADLSAALAAIPTDYQKGGMSIKFVQSSDNKYVQYRLMADDWSTNTENWAIVEECVYVENPEFVYVKTDAEGHILWAIKTDGVLVEKVGIESPKIKVGDLMTEFVENPEYLSFSSDSENKVFSAREKDGTLVEFAGINTTKIIVKGDISAPRLDKIEESIPPTIPAFGNMNLNINEFGFNNMVNSWWFYPMAVSSTTYRDKLYWGYTDKEGYSGVGCCDMTAKTPVMNKTILKREGADTHNAVSVSILPDERILAVYTEGHATGKNIYIRRSVQKNSIKDFELLAIVTNSGKATYSQVHYVNGKWYIFYRIELAQWWFTESSDLINWSEPRQFLQDSNSYQRYFLAKPIKNDTSKLKFVTYSNPDYSDTNIRCGYIDFTDGSVYDMTTNNIVGNLYSDIVESSSLSIVINQPEGANMRNRLFDLAVTEIDTTKILYCTFDASSTVGTDSEYYICVDGISSKICNGGLALMIPKYQLGLMFINETNIVSARGENGNDYIEIYTESEGTWIKTKDIYSESRGTGNKLRNGYPSVDIKGKYCIWLRGYFHDFGWISYSDGFEPYYGFDMDCMIYDIENEKIIN